MPIGRWVLREACRQAELKLDRAFIAELGSPHERGLVQDVIQLARSLGIDTVAEGVEHAAHVEARSAL